MEGLEKNGELASNEKQEIFSKAVRAGKRTYFFDVKSTRSNDFYLTITESKKRFNRDGRYFFEKHKIFLYKEDFEKFTEGLSDVIDFIRTNYKGEIVEQEHQEQPVETLEETVSSDYTKVDFEDLKD